MGIGILYESKEWSSYFLEKRITEMGVSAKLVDMETDITLKDLLSYDLIVNRICGSAGFRGHHRTLTRAPEVITLLRENGIPMLNAYEAHFYETGKAHSVKALSAFNLPAPKVYGVARPSQVHEIAGIEYPCIVKPDCGGRSNCTFIATDRQELLGYMKAAPDIEFIAEEYINPEFGYLTRVEIIDFSCRLALKRSIGKGGLSSFNVGSTYAGHTDFPIEIRDAAEKAARLLKIGTGSFDIVENSGGYYFIDVNSVSNASEDSNKMFKLEFGFDQMEETAAYIVGKYNELENAIDGNCIKCYI